MNPENNIPQEESTESVHSIIQKLKDGLLSIKTVDEETRLECVDTLRFEGCTISQIAQALKLSERTIKRYVKSLKDSHALAVDEKFQKETACPQVQQRRGRGRILAYTQLTGL